MKTGIMAAVCFFLLSVFTTGAHAVFDRPQVVLETSS